LLLIVIILNNTLFIYSDLFMQDYTAIYRKLIHRDRPY